MPAKQDRTDEGSESAAEVVESVSAKRAKVPVFEKQKFEKESELKCEKVKIAYRLECVAQSLRHWHDVRERFEQRDR